MLKLKTRSIIITLCVLISTIVFVCSSVLIYNIVKNYISRKFAEAAVVLPDDAGGTAGEYYFKDGALSSGDSAYTSNTLFYVSSLSDLKNFEESINRGSNFLNKKIILTRNINCNAVDLSFASLFSGTLDGDGYQISNFNINGYNVVSGYAGMKLHRYGLFNYFNGRIQGVHFDNFTCKIDASDIGKMSDWYIGGIVGRCVDNGAIHNCMVTNFNVVKSTTINPGGVMAYDVHTMYISGIAALGNPKISNCSVGKITSEYATINNKLHIRINGLAYGDVAGYTDGSNTYSYTNQGISIEKCVVTDSYDNPFTADKDQDSYVSNCYSSNTGDGFKNLGGNLGKGGEDVATNGYWYYYTEYTDNNVTVTQYSAMPYLRCFILWGRVNVNPNGSTNKSIEIYVPSSKKTLLSEFAKGNTNPTLQLCGESVTAEEVEGMEFTHWSNTYRARYTPLEYTINFAAIEKVSPSESSIVVEYNATIECQIKHTATETVITYIVSGNTVTYTLPNIYTIDYYGDLTNPSGTNVLTITNNVKIPSLTVKVAYTLTPKIKVKTYDATYN